MGLKVLLSEIEKAESREEMRIRGEAEAAIAAIHKSASEEAERIRLLCMKNLEPYLEKEKARRLNAAHRFALEEAGKIKSRLAFDIQSSSRLKLERLRQQPDYIWILKKLGDEAISQTGSSDVTLEIDARDRGIAACIWPELELRSTLNTAGGIRALSKDGLVVCDNTVEARLAKILQQHKVSAEFLH